MNIFYYLYALCIFSYAYFPHAFTIKMLMMVFLLFVHELNSFPNVSQHSSFSIRHLMLLECLHCCPCHRPPFLQFHWSNDITNSVCVCVCFVVECNTAYTTLPTACQDYCTVTMETMWPKKKIRLPLAGAYEVQDDCLCLSRFPDAIWLQGEQQFDCTAHCYFRC